MELRRRTVTALAVVCVLMAGAFTVLLLRAPELYTVTVLPSLHGLAMMPRSINDRGQVVGIAGPDSGVYRLFCWDREKGMQDLGPVCNNYVANNNAGQIVGTMPDPNGKDQAFLWDPDRGVVLLGTLGHSGSTACALNNRGQVVGGSFVPSGESSGQGWVHAFLWDETGGMRDLGTLGGQASQACGITDSGRVFGVSVSVQNGRHVRQTCYWETTGAAVSGTLPPGPLFSLVNIRGCIAGKYDGDKGGPHIVLWGKGTELRRLFPCKPDSREMQMTALVVNDVNQVACSETYQSGWRTTIKWLSGHRVKSYVWDPKRGKIRLGRYVPRGLRDLEVRDINNRGDILAEAYQRNGAVRVVLLEPIPSRWGR
jgi:probable HAF family extracellular repeat protein